MTDKIKIIARIKNDYEGKFGIPRQSGLVKSLKSKIIFENEYRDENALRGIEEWSYLWLIWKFSEAVTEKWSPTVRPPRLGGNKRVGVFATRSPFRPNPIGLSSVKLEGVEHNEKDGTYLVVSGADLMNGTPIYDIKPYLPYADAHPDEKGGFADEVFDYSLKVDFPQEMLEKIPEEKQDAIIEILSEDPRPSFQNDKERIYGFLFAGFEIKFRVDEDTIYVISVEEYQ